MRRRALLTAGCLTMAAALIPGKAAAVTTPATVLFVAAHPDDETIGMGVSLAEHAAAGLDVHVLWLTDGEGSGVPDQLDGLSVSSWWGVRHNPAAEGYEPFIADGVADGARIAAARVCEAANAVRALSTGFAPVTTHRAQLPDGHVTAADAQTAILDLCDQLTAGGPVRLKGHTYVTSLDAHPDHIAAGTALRNLKTADGVRFGDLRHYILPGYWNNTAALATVTRFWDNPTDAGIGNRVRNATRAYAAWAPQAGAYAIGYHSKSDWLDTIAGAPKCLIHS